MNPAFLLLGTLLGASGKHAKVMPSEAIRILADTDAVAIVVPGHNPSSPVVERVVCSSVPFDPNTKLILPPARPNPARETEDTYGGAKGRILILLKRSKNSWELANPHFGWIPLNSHKVQFSRYHPGTNHAGYYGSDNYLLIANELLLPGGLAKGDHGSLSESAVLQEFKAEFAKAHRR